MIDNRYIDPELLANIGLALEHYPLEAQTGMTAAAETKRYETDNQR